MYQDSSSSQLSLHWTAPRCRQTALRTTNDQQASRKEIIEEGGLESSASASKELRSFTPSKEGGMPVH